MINGSTELWIDDVLPFINCPHYCRDNADKVRWLALKTGLIKVIRLRDKVSYMPERACYRLSVEGDKG